MYENKTYGDLSWVSLGPQNETTDPVRLREAHLDLCLNKTVVPRPSDHLLPFTSSWTPLLTPATRLSHRQTLDTKEIGSKNPAVLHVCSKSTAQLTRRDQLRRNKHAGWADEEGQEECGCRLRVLRYSMCDSPSSPEASSGCRMLFIVSSPFQIGGLLRRRDCLPLQRRVHTQHPDNMLGWRGGDRHGERRVQLGRVERHHSPSLPQRTGSSLRGRSWSGVWIRSFLRTAPCAERCRSETTSLDPEDTSSYEGIKHKANRET
ncbi:hypothetical protein XENOCAPTIV_013872, partial [Xenoophorus captivus]